MKTRHFCTVVLTFCACLVATVLSAAEPGVPRGALFEAEDLSRWSVGAAFEMADRLAEGTATGLLEARSVYGMLNYDVFSFLTLSAGAGQAETKIAPLHGYGDGGFMWMAGARLNAWQYRIKDPDFMASRVRFQVAGSYWSSETDFGSVADVEWTETRFSALLCAEFFANEMGDDKSAHPYSTAIYLGPVFSRLDSDDIDLEQVDELGLQLALDVYLAHSLSLGYHLRTYGEFEHFTHTASVALHF